MAQQHIPTAGFVPQTGTGSLITDHIWAVLFLENDLARDHIKAIRADDLKRQQWQETPQTEALGMAYWALRDIADKNLQLAKDDGKLLMCWEGSTLLAIARRGGAA